MVIREARIKDLEQILEIYNYEVVNGVATLDLKPKTLADWKVWFYQHNVDNHPLYVAEEDKQILGYVSLSTYREKEAYKTTVELSVYVRAENRGQGVASALMEFILQVAREREDTHVVVSVITSGNKASRRLHQKFGFECCGVIREVGMKHGAYQDIENYQLVV